MEDQSIVQHAERAEKHEEGSKAAASAYNVKRAIGTPASPWSARPPAAGITLNLGARSSQIQRCGRPRRGEKGSFLV
jgi:hypothetical protein